MVWPFLPTIPALLKTRLGMKPTGKSFKYRDVDLLTFNDADRITEHRSVQSGKTMMDMVGAKMPK
jgi:hypothetical protein